MQFLFFVPVLSLLMTSTHASFCTTTNYVIDTETIKYTLTSTIISATTYHTTTTIFSYSPVTLPAVTSTSTSTSTKTVTTTIPAIPKTSTVTATSTTTATSTSCTRTITSISASPTIVYSTVTSTSTQVNTVTPSVPTCAASSSSSGTSTASSSSFSSGGSTTSTSSASSSGTSSTTSTTAPFSSPSSPSSSSTFSSSSSSSSSSTSASSSTPTPSGPCQYTTFQVQYQNAPSSSFNNQYLTALANSTVEPEVSYSLGGDPSQSNAATLILDPDTGYIYYAGQGGPGAYLTAHKAYDPSSLSFDNAREASDDAATPLYCNLASYPQPSGGPYLNKLTCFLGNKNTFAVGAQYNDLVYGSTIPAGYSEIDFVWTITGCSASIPSVS